MDDQQKKSFSKKGFSDFVETVMGKPTGSTPRHLADLAAALEGAPRTVAFGGRSIPGKMQMMLAALRAQCRGVPKTRAVVLVPETDLRAGTGEYFLNRSKILYRTLEQMTPPSRRRVIDTVIDDPDSTRVD